MRPIFTFLSIIFLINSLYAQKKQTSSAVSEKVFISIPKAMPNPPYLEIENYSFNDENSNNVIDAGEETTISFDLKNSGLGVGKGLSIEIKPNNDLGGLEFDKPVNLNELEPGKIMHIIIPVISKMNLKDGVASFQLMVNEPNGFGTDPLQMEIETQSFRPPDIKLVDHQVSSQMGSNLERKKPFDLEILIQNLGQGIAKDVSVFANIPENIYCISANQSQQLGNLESGDKKLISYSFVANNNYRENTIDFEFELRENTGIFTARGNVHLTMNQRVSAGKLVVRGEEHSKNEIIVASLSSDVDKNIPETSQTHPRKVALIFGNEDYSGTLNAEINVEYARRDASVFLEYAVRTLGIPEDNIYFNTDATAGTMNTEIERVTELLKRMGPETELIFYYAGHGFPDELSHTPYLIPVDVNASNLNSAIALKEVYKRLGNTGAKKITVILDACFSGGGRNQGLLAARGVRIKPKEEELQGNTIVFSASTDTQSALPYDEQKHGMFTYFLLKKLKATKGEVTFGELSEYLKNQVGINSLRVNGKIQDPVTTASPDAIDNWKKMTF